MHGLYLLWWVEERDLSPAVVAAILAAGDLALMALEIPTGWVADRFGHRRSLIVGSAVQVAGMLWCWLGAGVPSLIVASLLIALGDAFRSGADQALLYRSCAALGREDAFQRVEARTRAVETCALAGFVVAGGAIVSAWGFAAGWLGETLLCASGLGIAWAMVEPPAARESRLGIRDSGLGIGDSERGIRVGAFSTALLIAPVALIGAAAGAAAFLAQTAGGWNPADLTLLVAVIALAEAAGAAMASRAPAGATRQQWASLLVAVALSGVAVAVPATFYGVVIALSLLAGLAEPLRTVALQRTTSDDARARAASLASACDMLCSTIALPLAGFWRDRR